MTRPLLPSSNVVDAELTCKELSGRIDRLTGPGSNRVRSLLRRLIVALELREQDGRRLGAEVWRAPERSDVPRLGAPRRRSAFTVARRVAPAGDALQAIVHECKQLVADLAALIGRGAFAVQAAARQLVVALELYEQEQRRLRSEMLRREQAVGSSPMSVRATGTNP